MLLRLGTFWNQTVVRLVRPLSGLMSLSGFSVRKRNVRLVSPLSAVMSVIEFRRRERSVRLVSPLNALMSLRLGLPRLEGNQNKSLRRLL